MVMNEEQRASLFASIKTAHIRAIDRLQRSYLHKEVTLINTCKKSRGRAALIKGIIIQDGVPLFLCMVLRSGSDIPLNGAPWTRQYRPWGQFVINEELIP